MIDKKEPLKFTNFEIIIRNLDDPKSKPKAIRAHGIVFFAGTATQIIRPGEENPDLRINYGVVGDKVVNSLLFYQMPELVAKFIREQQDEARSDAELARAAKKKNKLVN